MPRTQTTSASEGLERSCAPADEDFISETRQHQGVELFAAHFTGEAYRKHRHDTYAVGVTVSGVQAFTYRGRQHCSTSRQVVVLHPDEPHDGRAGSPDGFAYRILHVEPALLLEALRTIRGNAASLPFVEPVITDDALARAVDNAFAVGLDGVALDDLVLELAEGLMAAAREGFEFGLARAIDLRAVERARQFLHAESSRVVVSAELEAITGLTRYDLCRQFKMAFKTSPHRYLLMRRLEHARPLLRGSGPLAEIAVEAGFADQSHFTRAFKAAFGLTPGRYRLLTSKEAG
jgi:AraC-like DNA-binding protein